MAVSRLLVELWIPGSRSLKEKRKVISSIRDRLGARNHLALAELDDQDKWQRAVLGIVSIGSSASRTRQSMEWVLDMLDEEPRVEVLGTQLEELE